MAYTFGERRAIIMTTAERFENGKSQAVMLPQDNSWKNTLASLDLFTDDFLAEPIEKLPVNEVTVDFYGVKC